MSPILLEPRRASMPGARGSSAPVSAPVQGRDFIVAQRALRGAASAQPGDDQSPGVRPLRIFTIDPTATCDDGAIATLEVPFEALEPGPAGSRLEVFDDSIVDGRPVEPLDLDDPTVLLRQGRDPSSTDPLFRAQMTYAVCSAVIETFGRALGRNVPWAFSDGRDHAKLRVRCSADGLRNAFYDPGAGELTFGTFDIPASATVTGRNVPGGRVSTALLHDVLAHETTHALLDGLRARSLCPSNPDVSAFHEAFADLVAILQRFSYPAVVRAGLQAGRGNLLESKLLTRFAEQFARTNGLGDALRDAAAEPKARDAYKGELEPHARGEVLLAAVFRAFCNVAKNKTRPTVRLATGGTSLFPPGELPEPVVALLTREIVDLARQFLSICIRAIDYCPPVDITFGEYLRAVITADAELVPHDPWGYRDAWVEAFLHYGIYPSDVVSLSDDALRWRAPQAEIPAVPGLAFRALRFDSPGIALDKQELMRQASELGKLVSDPRYRAEFGLAMLGDPALEGDLVDPPVIESINSARRVGPNGRISFNLVAEVLQRRSAKGRRPGSSFDFFGGATVILSPEGRVRYVVRKGVTHSGRLQEQREYIQDGGRAYWTQLTDGHAVPSAQPFLALHAFRARVPRDAPAREEARA